MKQNKYIRLAAVMLAVAALMALLTACGDGEEVVISNTGGSTAATTAPTAPTQPQQATLTNLILVMGSDMKWSDLAGFIHTNTDDSHAEIRVDNGKGVFCTLFVTYNASTDEVQEATICYGDVSYSLLTDDVTVLRKMMLATLEEDSSAQ